MGWAGLAPLHCFDISHKTIESNLGTFGTTVDIFSTVRNPLKPQAPNSLSYDLIRLKAAAAGTTKQHGEVPRHTQGRLGCNQDTYMRPMYALLPLGVSDFPYVPQYRDFDRSNRTKAAGTSGWSRGSG